MKQIIDKRLRKFERITVTQYNQVIRIQIEV